MAEFGKLNFSVAFNPTSAFPLDARTYFESLAEAQAAAASAEEPGSTNTIYYYGMKLLVNEGGVYTWYKIRTDKTLEVENSTTGEIVDDGTYVRTIKDATFQDKYISGIKYAADGEYENGLEYYRDKTYHAAPVGFVEEYVAEYVDTQLNAIETLLEQI